LSGFRKGESGKQGSWWLVGKAEVMERSGLLELFPHSPLDRRNSNVVITRNIPHATTSAQSKILLDASTTHRLGPQHMLIGKVTGFAVLDTHRMTTTRPR